MMKKIALFPGSFDPFTVGHQAIVTRSLGLFDKVVVMIGHNIDKVGFIPVDSRLEWLKEIYKDEARVEVVSYSGLTVDCCAKYDATHIVRGIRNSIDMEYEKSVAEINRELAPNIETILLFTEPKYGYISSTVIRDLIKHGKDISKLVPENTPIDQLIKL